MALSKNHPSDVRAFVGIHPSEAERQPKLGWLREALKDADGLGEVGLDPKYSTVDRDGRQMRIFREQLSIAEKTEKPAQVHSRGAERLCLDELASHGLRKTLLHWFQGEECARQASDSGHYVSFGPALIFSKKLERIASKWDPSHILTESDGPVAFASLGGSRGPALIPSVVNKLAEIRGTSFADAEAMIRVNSMAFLGDARKGYLSS